MAGSEAGWSLAVAPSGQMRVPGAVGSVAGNLEPTWEVLSQLFPNWGVRGQVLHAGEGMGDRGQRLGHMDWSFTEALKG